MKDAVIFAGYLVRYPLGGYAWQVVHYLTGLRQLGVEPYFYEDTRHYGDAYDPSTGTIGSDYGYGCDFAERLLREAGFTDRWVFFDVARNAYAGMDRDSTRALLAEARVVINAAGVHRFSPAERSGKTMVYIDMDPAYTQLRLGGGDRMLDELLAEHDLHFTFGENIGTSRSEIPGGRYDWRPTRQPVVMELWPSTPPPAEGPFTTVGKWDSAGRDVVLNGERYTWRKRTEWAKIIELPHKVPARFTIAMDVKDENDLDALGSAGWRVRDPLEVSRDPLDYQRFILGSRGEFTTAKDVNVRLRSGWFSDRSACYLAAGRPVVTQDTGFGDFLPVGEGLFAYRSLDDAAQAVRSVIEDPIRHGAVARRIAEACFDARGVLRRLLSAL
jgi:hypothetical protein